MSTTTARGSSRQLSTSGKGGRRGSAAEQGGARGQRAGSTSGASKADRGPTPVPPGANGAGAAAGNAWAKPLHPTPSSTPAPASGSQASSASASTSGTPAGSTPSGTPAPRTDSPDGHMHDRLLFLLAKSIGSLAVVTVASGHRYKGVLSAASTKNELGVVLRAAEELDPVAGIDDDSKPATSQIIDRLVITPKDCVDIQIEAPGTAVQDISVEPQRFKTDTDISARADIGGERELTRWTPEIIDNDGPTKSSLGSLEDLSSSNGSSWDQFAVNQQKFGVESSYDEHYYTTVIDKSHPQYQQRARRAERIAREISSSAHGGNVHLAEERGQAIDDSGLDEEDKYSGVDRRGQQPPLPGPLPHARTASPANAAKKYTPPAFRPPSGVKTAGVPYDPAIISSSLAPVDTPENPPSGKAQPNAALTDFRDFLSGEMGRMKSERIDGLKKFSEEYKINHPVPPDLVPILTKDKTKQEQIVRRAAANAAAIGSANQSPVSTSSSLAGQTASPVAPVSSVASATPQPEARKASPAVASPSAPSPAPTPPVAAPAAPKSAKEAKPKFNFNAPGFRPNPSASSFTPHAALAHPATSSPSPRSSAVPSPDVRGSQAGLAHSRRSSATPVAPHATVSASPTPVTTTLVRPVGAKSRKGKFNPFLLAKAQHESAVAAAAESKSAKPVPAFSIGPAFVTPPTWTATEDRSYVTLITTLVAMSPRVNNVSRTSVGGMPFTPSSPMPLGVASLGAIPTGAYDEMGNPILSNSPNPLQNMMPGMVPVPGYPQYVVSPYANQQFYTGRQSMGNFPVWQAQGYPAPRPGYYPGQPQYGRGGSVPSTLHYPPRNNSVTPQGESPRES